MYIFIYIYIYIYIYVYIYIYIYIYSGGHVIVAGSQLKKDIKCIISQIPHMDGKAASKSAIIQRGYYVQIYVYICICINMYVSKCIYMHLFV
jgi:hypothetical protein